MKWHLALIAVAVVATMPGGASHAGPIAVSTFNADQDVEGWLVVSTEGHSAPPHWSDVGGPDGGYIYDTDMDGGGWGFQAPAKFLGNVSAAYGHELMFDFLADKIGPDHDTVSVALSDPNGLGILVLVPAPLAAGTVAHRDIVLDETEDWHTFNYFSGEVGDPATPAEIEAVLSNLGFLFLGAELWNGYDDPNAQPPVVGELVAYDNITLMPEPTTLILLALGSLLMTRRRR